MKNSIRQHALSSVLLFGVISCNGAGGHDSAMGPIVVSPKGGGDPGFETGHRLIHSLNVQNVLLPENATWARQILIMHDESIGKPELLHRSHADAYAKAVSLRDRILSGEEFSALARAYSDCPSGRFRGGDIGFIRRGETVPVFEDALFALTENQLSVVIETEFGFHIIARIPRI